LAKALERAAAAIADVTLCRITGDDIISVRFQNEMVLQTIDATDGAAFSVRRAGWSPPGPRKSAAR
jgi:hypothetical protein